LQNAFARAASKGISDELGTIVLEATAALAVLGYALTRSRPMQGDARSVGRSPRDDSPELGEFDRKSIDRKSIVADGIAAISAAEAPLGRGARPAPWTTSDARSRERIGGLGAWRERGEHGGFFGW
jgi:hypothetical protein